MNDVWFAHGQRYGSTDYYQFTLAEGRGSMENYLAMARQSHDDPTLRVSWNVLVNVSILASFTEATMGANSGATFQQALEAVLRLSTFIEMYDEAPISFKTMLGILIEQWTHGRELQQWANSVGTSYMRSAPRQRFL